MDDVPRVVIVGAGFGGLAACRELTKAPVEVIVVDRHNYNTFQPLLYQVATGGLDPGDIAYPVRSYTRRFDHVSYRQEVVTGIDPQAATVQIAAGEPIAYDYLILAVGAATNYFGVPGAAEHALGIYTMEDATAVRSRLDRSLEMAASRGPDPGGLTVVIIGGGATGVELAGTLAELRKMQFETTYRDLAGTDDKVILVEMGERLLGPFDESLGTYAGAALRQRGVEIRCRETVAEVTATSVHLASGEEIRCGVVLWAAGVGPTGLAASLDLPKVHGRIAVEADLQVSGCANIFAVGDVAAAASGMPLPQLAQPALQGGVHAARQVSRLLAGEETEPFRYRDKGIMATIGRRSAVAQIGGRIKLRGTTAWLVWLGLHVVSLLGARNRLVVMLNWAWRYLTWRREPKVLAGQ